MIDRTLIRNQQVGGSSPLAGSTITLPFDKDLRRAPLRHALSHGQIMLATSDEMSTESVCNDKYHRAPRQMQHLAFSGENSAFPTA